MRDWCEPVEILNRGHERPAVPKPHLEIRTNSELGEKQQIWAELIGVLPQKKTPAAVRMQRNREFIEPLVIQSESNE
jgi:hypothetical protein